MQIPMEDFLRGCVYHDGRHGEVTLSTDKVLEIANYIQLTRTSLTDGCIEIPPSCDTCRFRDDVKAWNRRVCDDCISGSNYNRQADTPQTDLLVKSPQKSRESHEIDTPQTDCPWK